MTKVNVPLLRKAVEWVEEQDAIPGGSWDQSVYVSTYAPCGTVYCVAGYVGQLTDPRFKDTEQVNGLHVETVASKALGLTEFQARELFDEDNSAPDVRRIAERIAGEKL